MHCFWYLGHCIEFWAKEKNMLLIKSGCVAKCAVSCVSLFKYFLVENPLYMMLDLQTIYHCTEIPFQPLHSNKNSEYNMKQQ